MKKGNGIKKLSEFAKEINTDLNNRSIRELEKSKLEKERELEKSKLEKECVTHTNQSVIYSISIVCATIFLILFVAVTLGQHFKGEVNCTITNIDYEQTQYTDSEFNTDNLNLEDSTIQCNFKGDIPVYALVVMS